jgi:hypothetical protein
MQAQGYVMPWEEFKSKFSKAHVSLGLVKGISIFVPSGR